eukprot:TRINITY_DN67664_c0_g1_i1.p1 TRINITY_DN67664_c0_g1~~TRINITY_DN67664_c0_g1_i1.p1  ORF type:complete len:195 (-),score=34.97 TRINITY_DN67664_c0_g1_i1:236-820(-)
MLRTAARAGALCTLVVVGQSNVWNSESCFLQVNYDLSEHGISATAVAAGNVSQWAHGHLQQAATMNLSGTASNPGAKSLIQGNQNVSSIAVSPATLNASARDVQDSWNTAQQTAKARDSAPCNLFFGVPKFYWALLCDALGIAVLLLCIPCMLQCSKRRSIGASIFDLGCDSQPHLKPPPFTGHLRAALNANRG